MYRSKYQEEKITEKLKHLQQDNCVCYVLQTA